MKRIVAAMLSVAVGAPATLAGQAVTFGMEATLTSRLFPDAPLLPDQTSARMSPSAAFATSLEIDTDGPWWFVAEGFARVDAHDTHRSHVDLREFGVGIAGASFTAFAGAGQVFWGVTEVRHLVDVVNQIDAVEDLDGDDKLGQPMVSVSLQGGWGVLDVFYLPYARERAFPSADARLRGPFPIEGDASYASSRGAWHPTFAARAFRTRGAMDVGVSVFRGTAREPTLILATGASSTPVLTPHYALVDQIGLDAQWTGERTLLKAEAITRGGQGDRFWAVSTGVEYSIYEILGSDGDLGLIGEFMYDARSDEAPPTVFDRDLFLGGRWARNDVADTSLLAGPMVDLSSGELLVLLEARRRLGSAWRANVDVRLFMDTAPGSPVHGMRQDSYLDVSLTRYF